MADASYYEILGIQKTATQDEIKTAYRSLVKCYHPDVNPAANAATMFRLIQEAYETLSDPQKRSNYDRGNSSSQSTSTSYSEPQEQPERSYWEDFDFKKEYERQQRERAAQYAEYVNSEEYRKYASRFHISDAFYNDGILWYSIGGAKFVIFEAVCTAIVVFYYAHVEYLLRMEYSLAMAVGAAFLLVFLFQIKYVVWIITAVFSGGWGWLAFDFARDKYRGDLKIALIATAVTFALALAFHIKDATDP